MDDGNDVCQFGMGFYPHLLTLIGTMRLLYFSRLYPWILNLYLPQKDGELMPSMSWYVDSSLRFEVRSFFRMFAFLGPFCKRNVKQISILQWNTEGRQKNLTQQDLYVVRRWRQIMAIFKYRCHKCIVTLWFWSKTKSILVFEQCRGMNL